MDHHDASVTDPSVHVYCIHLLTGPNIEKREVPVTRYNHEPYASILRDYGQRGRTTTDEPSFEALGLGLHLGARRNPTETRIIFAQRLCESSARLYVTIDTEGTCEVTTVEPRPGGLSLPEIARSLLCGFLNRAPDLNDLGEPWDPSSSTWSPT